MYQYPALAIAHCLFWLIYASFEHVSHLLYGQNHWQGSLWASLFIMLATGALVICYKRMQHSLTLVKSFVLIFAGLIIVFVWHNLTRILHNHISLNELLQQPVLYWLEGSAYRILLFFTWAGVYLSAYNFLEKKRQQKQLQLNESKAKEAQLQLLMYQLNPHFLFNVLNSVDVAILEKNNDTAHNMLVKLSQFLRSTLEHKFQNKIPLKQELAILDRKSVV